jgi:hypothetical protein
MAIPAPIMLTASTGSPIKADTTPRLAVACAFQNKASFSPDNAMPSVSSARAVV